MDKHPDIEKFCKNCGGKIERKYSNDRIEDYTRYLAREHCCHACYLAMRKKKAALPPPSEPTKAEITAGITEGMEKARVLENLTPLDYLLREMNAKDNSKAYRKECAALAAPYCHPKLDGKSNKTKKEERADAAGRVVGGNKFAPTAPPKVIGRIG